MALQHNRGDVFLARSRLLYNEDIARGVPFGFKIALPRKLQKVFDNMFFVPRFAGNA